MSSSPGELAAGLIIPVIAGILNGSWNAAFSPAANLAVAPPASSSEKKKNDYDLGHHQAWVLFQFYSAIANVILCLFWAGGPARVSYIVNEASATSVGLVVLFSILMGVGILLFGEACRISGVGMGTNLTIGVITVLGTLLPLALEKQLGSASGGMILGGITVCCIGLFFSMRSLQIRTEEEEQMAEKSDLTEEFDNSNNTGDEEEGAKKVEAETANTDHSALLKITICVAAAVLSSTLQFAFVFGSDLIDIAESSSGPGATPKSGSAAIIWLFVIPLSTISSITYGLYQSRSVPLSNMWRSPLSRHIKIFVCACLPWIGHIHMYGIAANQLLPSYIAAAVAWPILMGTTVAWGMILSLILGEWKGASENAQKTQKIGIAVLAAGIAIVMASVALHDE